MCKKPLILLFFIIPQCLWSQAQFVKDTLFTNGDSVVVSATRSERKLSNLTVPVTLINAQTIQQTGSIRLTDILKEQTGLTMTSGFGAGIQLQGLNPDYTIILINGEPLVGRTAGVLDLNRIALGNIKKIEIVKGPSSSLYGSEAMAGVINIITDASNKVPLEASLRMGTYNTKDINLNSGLRSKSIFYQGFYNYYATDGYSIRPNSNNRITTPINRLTTSQQIKLNINDRTSILFNARLTDETIKSNIAVSNGGVTINSNGKEHNTDANLSATLNYRFTPNLKTSFRSYLTNYISKQDLLTISGAPYNDLLNHLFKRVENQTDWAVGKNLNGIFGMGAVWEGVKSSRYDSEKLRKENAVQYGFTQWEWTASDKFIIIGGIRFDKNATYASAWSPKLSMLYKLNASHKIRLSIGQGFKAPDFRQLYLNFTNAAAGNYSVFGSAQAQKVIGQLNSLGQIGVLYNNYYLLKDLEPESSNGMHLSWEWTPTSKTFINTQLFRNDITNLIEVQQVGTYFSGAQIFSYLNIGRAFTQGLELEFKQNINNHLVFSGGYQYLITGDKDQIAEIKAGTVYTRNASNMSTRLTMSDYAGLPNVSKHKAQLKINYTNQKGVFANARIIYRSKWAVNNTNGNEVYDNGDDFAQSYFSLHSSIGKEYQNGLTVQLGADNINNYIDAIHLPNLAGRTYFINLKYQIKYKSQK
ncbi:MAG: TonB-dependent receptor [Chitinophagaceae bacterium]|nr:TonB-dependent receptor [Chitinophagaceae bacterium]